jgi:hypothetical protein
MEQDDLVPVTRGLHGYFEGYDVRGTLYANRSGKKEGWHIHLNPEGSNEFNHYWVTEAGAFHSFRYRSDVDGKRVILTSATITETPPPERRAILAALGEWDHD